MEGDEATDGDGEDGAGMEDGEDDPGEEGDDDPLLEAGFGVEGVDGEEGDDVLLVVGLEGPDEPLGCDEDCCCTVLQAPSAKRVTTENASVSLLRNKVMAASI